MIAEMDSMIAGVSIGMKKAFGNILINQTDDIEIAMKQKEKDPIRRTISQNITKLKRKRTTR